MSVARYIRFDKIKLSCRMEFEMNLEQTLNEITGKMYGKNIGACTDAQLYTGVLQLTKEKMAEVSILVKSFITTKLKSMRF